MLNCIKDKANNVNLKLEIVFQNTMAFCSYPLSFVALSLTLNIATIHPLFCVIVTTSNYQKLQQPSYIIRLYDMSERAGRGKGKEEKKGTCD